MTEINNINDSKILVNSQAPEYDTSEDHKNGEWEGEYEEGDC